MRGKIYKVKNLKNGKTYIGQSSRKKKDYDKYYGSGVAISKALKKYGKENFEKTTLFETRSQKKLDEAERHYIKKMKPDYNIAEGGRGITKPIKRKK